MAGPNESDTKEISLDALSGKSPSDRASEPPTAITSLKDIMGTLVTADRWSLSILSGSCAGLTVPLDKESNVIGRGSTTDIRVTDDGLSRKHAEFFRQGRDLGVRDLGSTNGTFVSGERISGPTTLKTGTWLQLGGTAMRVVLQSQAELTAAQKLYDSSVRDPLTGLYNRRHLDERLDAEFAYSERHRQPLSAMLIDVDHFKKVNDTWGHQAGDALLRLLSDFLQEALRREDLAARYGGEEFVILLRGIDCAGAMILAERIRKGIEGLEMPWGTEKLSFTVSIGVATHSASRPYANAERLVTAADECLYRAKESGRNLVIPDATPQATPPGTM